MFLLTGTRDLQGSHVDIPKPLDPKLHSETVCTPGEYTRYMWGSGYTQFYDLGVSSDTSGDLSSLYKHYVEKIAEDKRYKLDHEIKSDEHISRLAQKLMGWEEKFYLFYLTHIPDVKDITTGINKDKPELQR